MNPNIKQIAVEFLELIILGNIDEAYAKHVDLTGEHHNIHTPQGFPALREGMKESHIQFPNKRFSIKHVLGDGDFVSIHSNLVLNTDVNLVVVHLFRFKENKIIEMWDCAQLIPINCSNADGAF